MITRIDSIVETRARLAAEAEAAEQARLAALQAEKDSQYRSAVAKGDSLFTIQDYSNSRIAYESAIKIKPDESYPKERISEIEKLIQEERLAKLERERLEQLYKDAIFIADQQLKIKNFPQAKENYTKALNIRPEEEYPGKQLAVVDSLIKQQQLDESYRSVLLAADGQFRAKSYTEAKDSYQSALSLKPDEKYPAGQISKIDEILKQEEARVLAEQQTASDLEERRKMLEQQKQEQAEDSVINEAGLNELYDQYILKADNFFENKQYNISRAWYYQAWDLKPKETYPPQRISEINRLVNGLLLSQRDRDYQEFINLGDSTFRANQLAVARGWYNRALSVKDNDSYPKDQLEEINRLIEERLAGRSGQLFEQNFEKAEKAFNEKNYNVARFWYKKALELRPDDANTKKRLGELEKAVR
jgi:hypothetical protein